MTENDAQRELEDAWRAVKVGVRLAPAPEQPGDWLADASAFDAAGADALWLDTGPDSEWDCLALTAALSVTTFRSLLVVAVPYPDDSPAWPARTLTTIARLSHGRLALIVEPDQRDEFAALTPAVRIFQRRAEQPDTFDDITVPDGPGRWVPVSFPENRAAWRAARADAAERGVRGLLVPPDPRLLDVLRNPDDPEGRGDLLLAQG